MAKGQGRACRRVAFEKRRCDCDCACGTCVGERRTFVVDTPNGGRGDDNGLRPRVLTRPLGDLSILHVIVSGNMRARGRGFS